MCVCVAASAYAKYNPSVLPHTDDAPLMKIVVCVSECVGLIGKCTQAGLKVPATWHTSIVESII